MFQKCFNRRQAPLDQALATDHFRSVLSFCQYCGAFLRSVCRVTSTSRRSITRKSSRTTLTVYQPASDCLEWCKCMYARI